MHGRQLTHWFCTIAVVFVATLGLFLWTPGSTAARPPGDADCNGTVNSIDAALILQFAAGVLDELPCPFHTDVNESGETDSVDAATILQREARLFTLCLDAREGQDLIATLVLQRNRTRFSHGEPVSMTLFITNCGSRSVTRQYDTAQTFEFAVTGPRSSPQWRWSHGMTFEQLPTSHTFRPGVTVSHRIFWNQKTSAGDLISSGNYEVAAYDAECLSAALVHCDVIDRIVVRLG